MSALKLLLGYVTGVALFGLALFSIPSVLQAGVEQHATVCSSIESASDFACPAIN